MADAFALASAAAERRKAGAPRIGALPRPKHQQTVTFVGVARNGWHAPFGASPPSFLRMILSENRTPLFGIMRVPGANLFLVRPRRQSSDA